MVNHPDHEYQRIHLLRAIRFAQIEGSELWLHYFGLGGDAGEYEVEAYLHGSFMLPPLQRDLLAHAANELIDRIPPPPRAPYSTDPPGTVSGGAGGSTGQGDQEEGLVPGEDGTALQRLLEQQPGDERPGEPGGRSGQDSDDSGSPRPHAP